MKLRLLFFGALSDHFGSERVEALAGEITAEALLERLIAEIPEAAGVLKSAMIAVNTEYVSSDQLLVEADEVAFLPPVSGG